MHGREYFCSSLAGGAGKHGKGSCKCNLVTGRGSDFASGESWADPIGLFRLVRNLPDRVAAAKVLAAELKYDLDQTSAPARDRAAEEVEPLPLPPDGHTAPSIEHPMLGLPVEIYIYRTPEGKPWFYVGRYQPKDGRKQFIPWTWDGQVFKAQWPRGQRRPLFGLEQLAAYPDLPVLVVEGERKCEAARQIVGLRYVVVSWMGGAGAVERADLAPLRGRKILLWPDADRHLADARSAAKYGIAVGAMIPYEQQPGPKAVQTLAGLIVDHCPEVKVFDVGIDEMRPDGWDAADALEAGWGWNELHGWATVPGRVRIYLKAPVTEAQVKPAPDGGNPLPHTWEPPVPFHEHTLPEFPAEALPAWLQAFVEREALATQTPTDMVAMLALSVCAASCAKKVVVRAKPGYTEPLNIYAVVVLPPGNRKSAVFRDAAQPLEAFERSEVGRRKGEIAEAESLRRVKEKALHEAERLAAKQEPGEEGDPLEKVRRLQGELRGIVVPIAARYIIDDCSPEKVTTILHEQGGRIAAMSPEGDLFEIIGGRYSNSQPNLGVFLKGHAGDTLRVDRVGRPSEFVKDPALTVGLAVQPDVLRSLMAKPGFRGRGLLARFFYSLPKSLVGRREVNPPPLTDDVRDNYQFNVTMLLGLATRLTEDGAADPYLLELASGARALLDEFSAWLEPRLGEDGELAHLADWGAKLVGAVARIAGILHMAEHAGAAEPWTVPISAATVERAILIGKYLIPHAQAAFDEMGANPETDGARRVLEWIQRSEKSTFTKRDAYQGTKGFFKRVKALGPVLELLVDHGFLRTLVPPGERSGPGRKPSDLFEVNPQSFTQNPHNSQNGEVEVDSGNTEQNGRGEAAHGH